MKKFGALFLIIISSGCTYAELNSSNPLTPTEQLCQELKRNIIFNTTSGPAFGSASVAQKAQMYRLYDKYNCRKLEKK